MDRTMENKNSEWIIIKKYTRSVDFNSLEFIQS